jgi:perosamine synthetase
MTNYTIDYESIPGTLVARQQIRRLEDLVPGAALRHFALGRAALLWLCRAMGWGAGDRVLVPSFACYSIVSPFIAAGLTPVFYNVRDDLSVDVDELSDWVRRGVRCGLIIHYFGWLQAPHVRRWLAAQTGPAVFIEDLSHALFTAMRSGGAVAAGQLALTSYRKLMPCPDGSTLIFRDPPETTVMSTPLGRRYRAHGIVRSVTMRAAGVIDRARPAALLAAPALASVQRTLKRWRIGGAVGVGPMSGLSRRVIERFPIDDAVASRRRNAAHLAARLSMTPGCAPLMLGLDDHTVPMALPVRVGARAEVERALRARGVLAQHLWPLPPDVQSSAFPAPARLADELLCFPVDERYSVDDMDAVADTVKSVVADVGSAPAYTDRAGRVVAH